MSGVLRDDSGSATVEFVLVGIILTGLTLAVLQTALALYVRNVAQDAAVEAAYYAARADVEPREGAERARVILERTLGREYVSRVHVSESPSSGALVTQVTVRATLPLVGLWGLPEGWEVTAHAPSESLDG